MPGFIVIIPARFASTRLPGKPLIDLAGKSMIQRVYEQATASSATTVYVATDSVQVAEAVSAFGGNVLMTSAEHGSGSERLAECVDLLELAPEDCVVNVQGDEPMLPPGLIDDVAAVLLHDERTQMSTLATPISTQAEFENPNAVKVVLDGEGRALYFSRAPIPFRRDGAAPADGAAYGLRHLGIYGYRASFLREYVNWTRTEIEDVEALEQLRALWHGARIRVDVTHQTLGPGIDTQADVDHVLQLLKQPSGVPSE
ncbi:3-deoxy-manno-octulosonate cytidylyltransferase [Allohahella marinimesophila]|uniref:3-deoxy-manno-octulosonate cytidylyltransferase n=1 Tax=Allohahella marinimesophila TaxID=1054972 RepID=A0ABP7Q964_9GAMM